MTDTLAPSYDPGSFESRLYAEWEAAGVFAPRGDGPAYTILLPPPNVTGTLHMGHAFQHTLQDALVRYHRMLGHRTLWQMGSDHAGIATEMVVGRNLALEGKGETRDSLGREGFIAKVWEWKQRSGDTIERQMRRLGTSGDWSRSVFTMDPMPSKAVVEAFVRLHEQGLIYRGKRLVNWDPALNTAISDLEVENREVPGHMWHFKYPLAGGEIYEYVERDSEGNVTLRETRDYISIATTRPETMLGDGAVAVHPDDARYAPIVGKLCEIPVGPKQHRRLVPIITDEYPDPDFGSGAVKITGAHDFNDYAVAARNGIPLYALMDAHARMRSDGLSYEESARIAGEIARGERAPHDVGAVNLVPDELRGLDRYEARARVVEAITAEGLAVTGPDGAPLVESKPIMQPFGDRSGSVIEPYLTDQWFVRMDTMGRRGMELVENGSVKFVPPNWISTYRHWMENIQDWTISRQLWWGHRIPAWFDAAGNAYVGRDEADARARAGIGSEVALRQDEDVLETWFSSALWPFSTLGWPDADAMRERGFDTFLPTSVLVTGFDIIFFWVARMVMMTDALTGKVAFDDVYITGLVRDKDGQKMSKSKGNILDPLDIIDGISADALVAKRTTGLMKPTDAPKIEKATRREFPDGIAAHGADPLRFTMAALAGPGRDIKFDLGRAEGYKNFCNKLWNATRFVLMNTDTLSLPPHSGDGARRAVGGDSASPVTDAEKWILSRLARVSAEAQAHFAAYRFDLLAQALYEFAWNEFCDWFVELAKPALNGDDRAAADSTRRTLLTVLEALLRLLHPLVPFVTEELWRQVAPRLGIEGDTISLQRYPQAGDVAGDDFARAEADIEWLKQMVTALRRIRSELGVSPMKQVPLLVQAGSADDRARLARFAAQLRFLNRLSAIDAVEGEPPASAAGLVGELRLFVPLEGLVDLDAERARLDKELARVSAEKDKSQAKLAKFSDKVPAAVVEQERQRLADWTAQHEALSAQRARLA
ncbi:valine--tRNA ligase [Luteimonas sp. M1R5S18]|uniref:Valine--tRNA ligase n=1 Tax=Luteimonas rhizosphaericola TaxID=3042024 RepID=A0ABT6JHZ8_9GAMM|nr:valine--tRNA ligase [Luteimonas rhizosphaericola]MDH5830304.1 valine--tRNA ligase [Luteimonas rhizosphaericola]